MGIFGGLFGPKYPELAADHPANDQLSGQGEVFESFVSRANDTIEVIPGAGPLYVFVGKPPKVFGIVWFEDDEQFDVRSQVERRAMTRESAAALVGALGRIYAGRAADERFAHRIDGHAVTVTPSTELYAEVHQAVQDAQVPH